MDRIKQAIINGHQALREGSMIEADGKITYIVDEMAAFFCTAYPGEDGTIIEVIRMGSHETTGRGSIFSYPDIEAFEYFHRTGLDSGEIWLGEA